MNGVKYFGGHTPDQVVAYGSAVISAAGSGLSKIFEEQLEIRGARRYSVSKLRRYEVGGVGAEIGPDSVLVGSLRFMQSTGVDMPAGTRVSQAVYVAINGSLAGVFAVHYEVSRAVVGAGSPHSQPGDSPGDHRRRLYHHRVFPPFQIPGEHGPAENPSLPRPVRAVPADCHRGRPPLRPPATSSI